MCKTIATTGTVCVKSLLLLLFLPQRLVRNPIWDPEPEYSGGMG